MGRLGDGRTLVAGGLMGSGKGGSEGRGSWRAGDLGGDSVVGLLSLLMTLSCGAVGGCVCVCIQVQAE